MATEYIKREDALNAIRKSPISNMGTRIFCIDAIADIPAADVVERKHGEWIHRTGNRDECSNCGARYYQDLKEPFMNFCPNCGSQMGDE